MIKSILAASISSALLFTSPITKADWQDTLQAAQGQTVYFNAWGGADNINQYIQWAAERIEDKYQVTLKQVKLTDTADAVNRVLAEKAAGQDKQGSIDLIWLNGENFRAMKDNQLLFGPFSQALPNYQNYVDEDARQSLTQDFGTQVDGMESPWGMAQVIFMYDTATLSAPPKSMTQLLAYAQANPGRITYPEPPQFLGSTFLKQALYELSPHRKALSQPVDKVDVNKVTAPLWAYLDQLHSVAWRSGQNFPSGAEEMMRLLDDQEIDIALSFDISAASVQIDQGNLPDTVRSYVFQGGTIGNTHFLAIPYNSSATAGAQVVANFLLSPEAQIRKQTPTVWGDLSVLSYDKLSAADQQKFDALPRGIATLSIEELGQTLPEPHSSWVSALETEWRKRYAN
ncbi:ABC transporter substrate-binding protein [Marinomonas posidonica]|uniref:Extracellular solute-binding protein family 1 n=1 Tax=Marinomonas posidonica (strain CECT 7376 / NCIMB 14433 / IVIA-Po-181) TaxID=491952 RepID=F6CYK0_MARPP|nr:ABC transporter substrate-binding protein [Marinomonas posidonica]AEF54609.1 extracellular solute-binding protein family 1 [Marinomonas posidonica IVIA-Po-181]